MALKPIFVATHPRACSTAFERVFMTCRDTLTCIHEPFGDAWYYGPERHSKRFEDEQARLASGLSKSTYKSVLDGIEKQQEEGKRIFIKDMAYYLCPLEGPASIAPSLGKIKRGVGTDDHVNGVNGVETFPNGIHPTGEDDSVKATHAATGALPNPTVFPEDVLNRFHFAFLIRHPSKALPSYYRCMVPPLVEMTGFSSDHPLEAGYCELRLVFDYLRSIGQVGPAMAGSQEEQGSGSAHIEICVVDADDMLEDPSGFIETFCNSVGVQYKPEMLKWDTHGDQEHARKAFAKWKGFHEDALDSEGLTAKTHKPAKTLDQEHEGWVDKYGKEAADRIRKDVEASIDDYNYLKQFAFKV